MGNPTGVHKLCMGLLVEAMVTGGLLYNTWACHDCVEFVNTHASRGLGIATKERRTGIAEPRCCPMCGTPLGIMPKFPHVHVPIGSPSGPDGNSYVILWKVRSWLKAGGASKDELDAFAAEAAHLDYAYLLGVASKWVWLASDGIYRRAD